MIRQDSPNIEGGQRAIDNYFYSFSSLGDLELRNSDFLLGVTSQLRSGILFHSQSHLNLLRQFDLLRWKNT